MLFQNAKSSQKHDPVSVNSYARVEWKKTAGVCNIFVWAVYCEKNAGSLLPEGSSRMHGNKACVSMLQMHNTGNVCPM